MTLGDFVQRHRSLAEASTVDQVLAIAWFWRTHEPNRILCYGEMTHAFNDIGLDSTDLLRTWQALITDKPVKLVQVELNNYKLSLSVLHEIDKKYAESPLLPAGSTQNRFGQAVQSVAPAERRGETSTKPLPTMDRSSFLRTLADLTPADFELFVATIPNAAPQISRQGTISEKVAELIRWVDSSTGPGIGAVQEAYRNFW
jgi:hypothetical protein